MENMIINATLAKEYGLTLEQAMLYKWILDNSSTWVKKTRNGFCFAIISKDEMLVQVSPVYTSKSGLQATLLRMQSRNLLRLEKSKDYFAICLNQDLEFRWCSAHKGLNHDT